MLEEVLQEIHNWFRINDGKHYGTFVVGSDSAPIGIAENFDDFSINSNGHLILSYTGKYVPYFEINSEGHLIYNIELPFLREGQYFRIKGSVFNDGLYVYGDKILDGDGKEIDLVEETFVGEIWALAVPKAVISLSQEIAAWNEKYASEATSPYSSESFGGYSYTKSAGVDTIGGAGWQSVFRPRLNKWRKINED